MAIASNALTDEAYWDDVYRNGRRPYTYPDPKGNRFHLTLARVLARHVQPGMDALELGCGGSLWLPYLARTYGCQVAGIDLSGEGLRKARAHLDQQGVSGTLHQVDLFHPPDELLQRFDFVYSLGVVEHFNDPAATVRACVRFLKPGGTILTWIPNTAGWIMQLQRWADREIYDRHVPISLEQLVDAHRANGLDVRETQYTRWLDLSMVNVYRWPLASYRRWMTLAGLVNVPLRWVERTTGWHPQSGRLGASAHVVAQLPTG